MTLLASLHTIQLALFRMSTAASAAMPATTLPMLTGLSTGYAWLDWFIVLDCIVAVWWFFAHTLRAIRNRPQLENELREKEGLLQQEWLGERIKYMRARAARVEAETERLRVVVPFRSLDWASESESDDSDYVSESE